jgi:hypothetical protein
VDYANDTHIPLLKQIERNLLFRFQESSQGRRVKNPAGEFYVNPKSDIGKDREQGFEAEVFRVVPKEEVHRG